MELNVLSSDKSSKKIQVSDAVFNREFNEALVHQVVTAYLAGSRAGTKAQKTRSDVSGGGIKPWRQKGTGRARAGTIRSPLWRKGGKVFAATPRDYSQKVNRKMYQGALRSILSELIRQERMIIVEDLGLSAPKTRELVNKLKELDLKSVLIVDENIDRNLMLAARNLHKVLVCESIQINPANLLSFDKVLITTHALKQLEEKMS